MGIKGLTQLIGDNAPEAIVDRPISSYFNRKIAIDASMALYAFLIAVRADNHLFLTNKNGETTSHLVGLWGRTLKFLKYDIIPIYVFDGEPPELKRDELKIRESNKQKAEKAFQEAKEIGDSEAINKYSKRNVRVTRKQINEAKRLLELMGIPFIEAPCEAEAQCAELVKTGKVWAVGSEDMDTLTCGAPILLRNLNYSEAMSKVKPIREIHLEKVLEGMKIDMNQFIDLCILSGCDYCEKIRGIGPKRAFSLIKKHGNIEKILESLDTKKHPVPDYFPYREIRDYFINPPVIPSKDINPSKLKIQEPDVEGLIQFLVVEQCFNEGRVEKGIDLLIKNKKKSNQTRITSFFKIK